MSSLAARNEDAHQAQFQLRWGHLRDAHVRALAWLIDAPVLLDAADPAWEGRIATLDADAGDAAAAWLEQLDQDPQALHALIGSHPFARLGRYAEQLMAFYFSHLDILFAHGLQVRNGSAGTAGEFDFLLTGDHGLRHWEFATKFYLLERPDGSSDTLADYFIGPNLADTLGNKMKKILGRQLALSRHPAAQGLLPQPVVQAKALVKGWLFYHGRIFAQAETLAEDLPVGTTDTLQCADAAETCTPDSAAHHAGVASAHCHGFWCESKVFREDLHGAGMSCCYAILPRLAWLAPVRMAHAGTLDASTLLQELSAHFEKDVMPVMVALLVEQDGSWRETRRGFIVPDDWRARAGERRQGPGLS